MIPVIFLICITCMGVSSINRPVYKIVLNQKGYAQFLQYDIETPPLREFTFCTWFRIYDLFGDQSIFSYIANSNNRVVRLWLDSGGRQMKVSIDGRVTSSSTVDIAKNVWRHVCLSYQSDYGAWALYLDARLVTCEVAQSLQGYVLPEGGSVIVGYGTNDNGAQNGLDGEIFGANMFLVSTIEKNYTIRSDPQYKQRVFNRNKIKGNSDNVKYVILKDLQTGELKHNIEMTELPVAENITRNYIKFRTPYSFIQHDVGVHLKPTNPDSSTFNLSEEKEILDFPTTYPTQTLGTSKLWNFDKYGHTGRFKMPTKVSNLPGSSTATQDLVMLSEYETPPPVPSQSYSKTTNNAEKPFVSKSIYKLSIEPTEPGKSLSSKAKDDLPEYETPPPVTKNTKVYGQWTSSKFAGSVLNHLKNIQFNSKDQKKIPATIPLIKMSDTFPYASDFKITKLRPPPQFQRKKIVERRFDTHKRSPQINVQILEDDLRNNILKSHAQTQLKHVEITNRGVTKQHTQHRFYRKINSQELDDIIGSSESTYKPAPFSKKTKYKDSSDYDLHTNNLISILPFLKSFEYFTEDTKTTDANDLKSNKMYTKSLSSGNKWHNVKSYSNDYTPRKINVDSENGNSGIDNQSANPAKNHPSVLLKYRHERRKVIPNEEESILKGRKLALTVSNQSDHNKDSISIFKYNHGFLPGHKVTKNTQNTEQTKNTLYPHVAQSKRDNFNKHVKIGNALNERQVIGVNEEQKKRSFVGGDDSVPDINRYRSDIDNEYYTDVPSSLRPRICKNIELYDRVLYVQPDESIDMTHILSPVKAKNLGIEFVMQNYKKCSLEESNLQVNAMLFIDWSKTPVRLFGGAYPIKTTDLCGFF